MNSTWSWFPHSFMSRSAEFLRSNIHNKQIFYCAAWRMSSHCFWRVVTFKTWWCFTLFYCIQMINYSLWAFARFIASNNKILKTSFCMSFYCVWHCDVEPKTKVYNNTVYLSVNHWMTVKCPLQCVFLDTKTSNKELLFTSKADTSGPVFYSCSQSCSRFLWMSGWVSIIIY